MLMKMRGQMQKGRNQKGFTLVELMVVVVIIGILSAIAVPVYSSVTAKANRSAVEANLRTIDGAIMAYQTANSGKTPKVSTDLVPTDATETKYLQEWPSGPDNVEYSIDNGRATAAAASGDDETGDWFTPTAPVSLPIDWDESSEDS